MTSQKFQLTEEYKRKQKNFDIFLVLFFVLFLPITTPYALNDEFSWITISISSIMMLIIILFVFFIKFRKNWKDLLETELEFKDNNFTISDTDYRHIVYSDIREVIFYKNTTGKLLYIKLVLPKKRKYLIGFERENELVEIIKSKIEKYNIITKQKIKYIDNTNYCFMVLQFLVSGIIFAIISHYFTQK